MRTLKDFYKELVEKYWNKYQREIIGAGFDYSTKEDIRRDIDKYLDENDLYSIYNREEYENDTDEYVKYVAFNDIKKYFGEMAAGRCKCNINTPKRFESYCSPRDW